MLELSLAAVNQGYCSLWCEGFLIVVVSLVEHRLGCGVGCGAGLGAPDRGITQEECRGM